MYCIINVDAFIAKLCLPPISLVMFAAVLIRFEIHFECFLLFFFIATILVLEYTKHENRNHWFQANIFNCSIQPAIPLVDFVHYMDYKHTDTHTHKFMRTHWLIECLNNRNGLTLKLYCNTNDKHHRSNFFFLFIPCCCHCRCYFIQFKQKQTSQKPINIPLCIVNNVTSLLSAKVSADHRHPALPLPHPYSPFLLTVDVQSVFHTY